MTYQNSVITLTWEMVGSSPLMKPRVLREKRRNEAGEEGEDLL